MKATRSTASGRRALSVWWRALLGGAALLAWLVGAGCAGPAVDLEAAGARHPELAAAGTEHLRYMRPYYLPAAGQLALFTCRWPDGATIPVQLPEDASSAELRRLRAALDAWEGAGLGLRFELRPLEGVGIEIQFPEDLLPFEAGALVDCAVESAGIVADAERLPAKLVKARVEVARKDPRLTGTLVHELGHALGFQGHAKPGRRRARGAPRASGTIMRRDPDLLREVGERVLDGKPFRDPSLAALYALPSGTVLGRLPMASGHTRSVDRMLEIGREQGLVGPLVRVGDDEGRIAWLDAESGRVARLLLTGLGPALEDPGRLEIEPSIRARALLEGR